MVGSWDSARGMKALAALAFVFSCFAVGPQADNQRAKKSVTNGR
jgi:hypothetical protein